MPFKDKTNHVAKLTNNIQLMRKIPKPEEDDSLPLLTSEPSMFLFNSSVQHSPVKQEEACGFDKATEEDNLENVESSKDGQHVPEVLLNFSASKNKIFSYPEPKKVVEKKLNLQENVRGSEPIKKKDKAVTEYIGSKVRRIVQEELPKKSQKYKIVQENEFDLKESAVNSSRFQSVQMNHFKSISQLNCKYQKQSSVKISEMLSKRCSPKKVRKKATP
mmetsp:Transcript_42315/g.40541  ORF Transcript_42315/g.40541 Transcript_42315/m.40541 type:complete len:218 (-) Transcript_42315:411-1064(-)